MRALLIAFDQEPVVFGVVDSRFVVLTSETLDRIDRLPQRESHELGPVAEGSAQEP
jgi:hypothetical protein